MLHLQDREREIYVSLFHQINNSRILPETDFQWSEVNLVYDEWISNMVTANKIIVKCIVNKQQHQLNACWMAISGVSTVNPMYDPILLYNINLFCISLGNINLLFRNITLCWHYPSHWPLMLAVPGSKPAGFRGQCRANFSASSPMKTTWSNMTLTGIRLADNITPTHTHFWNELHFKHNILRHTGDILF